jgi:hypothetical protein
VLWSKLFLLHFTTKTTNLKTSEEQMKFNKWTVALAAVGAVSLTSAARADEAPKLTALNTALSNTTVSGFVDVSAVWNPQNQNAYNASGAGLVIPPYSYNSIGGGGAGTPGKADGFNLDSVDIAIDRPQDESPWAAGYHVELQLGPDAPSTPRQAYVVVRTPVGNGIDWKIGVWDTIIGYESSSDPLNPNFTRSYGYSMEPTTHTGVLATYKVCNLLTVQAGVADSSNVGLGSPGAVNGRATYEGQKTYMAAVALTAPDSWGYMKGASLNLGAIHSVDSAANGPGTRDNYYAGITIPTPLNTLKVGAAFDYYGSTPSVNVDSSYSWDAAVYVNFQATDKLSFNGRAEYFDDGASSLGLYASNVYPTFASETKAEEVTLTAQYNLWANVISRVEFRWDHVENGSPFDANTTTGNPDHKNAFLVAANLIYQF